MNFPRGLTFDDVLLLPNYADFSRSEINLTTKLTKTISLKLPFVSAPMDTVTERTLAIELARLGGIGIIHRNLSIGEQAEEVEKVKKENLIVGAAIGASAGFEDRVEALVKAGVDVIVVDSAHGYAKSVINATRFIKQKYQDLQIITGNIATYDAAKALIQAGVDGLRVGMGPGAICTTRIISGMGVPQITAIFETARAARSSLHSSGQAGSSGQTVPIIADGGIKFSGDIVKALAAGASAVMMGSFFASAKESPGKTIELDRLHVPQRFQSILDKDKKTFLFKEYRGMGSEGAMQKGAAIKSEDEFHGKDYKDRVLVAEGVEALVPVKGMVKEIVDQALGGIKSGMYYVGAKSIAELWEKAQFIQITQASLTESHPHSILITNPGENYS
ncbi:MAG: IMP dehydrogenase [Candidatus Levybacteria bacterium]|nr:IMP dehydrogenase [Candidatus Levybacteria bacterium]